jgi:NADH-quinone oxidoreductase subunit G
VTGAAGSIGAALCRIPQGANALGLARYGVLPASRDAGAMLAQPRAGYVIYGIEPGLDFADQPAAMKALGAAQVVAFSHFACASTRAVADVILPIGLLPEIDATLTNLDGRDQVAVPAGKLPGDARAGWRVLRALCGMLELPGFDFTDLAGMRAGMAAGGEESSRGARAAQGKSEEVARNDADETGQGFELAVTSAIYRVDGVTRRAAALQAHPLTLGPRITLHTEDAKAAGLADDAMAKVTNAAGTATLPVATSDSIARGVAWVESGYGATAALGAGRIRLEAA